MRNVAVGQFFVQTNIYGVKEVFRATIENYFQTAGCEQVQLIDYCIFFPVFRKLALFPQPQAQVPVVGEGANIHAAAHTSTSSEYILMAESQIHRSVSAHAEAGNGTSGGAANGFVIFIYPLYKFTGNVSFVFEGCVYRAIEIPAAIVSIGAYNDKLVLVGQVIDVGHVFGPVIIFAAIPVKQIQYRHFIGFRVGIGGDNYRFNVFLHRRTEGEHCVHFRSKCIAGCKTKH